MRVIEIFAVAGGLILIAWVIGFGILALIRLVVEAL